MVPRVQIQNVELLRDGHFERYFEFHSFKGKLPYILLESVRNSTEEHTHLFGKLDIQRTWPTTFDCETKERQTPPESTKENPD